MSKFHPGMMNWDDEVIALIKSLIKEKLSTGIIAERLSERFGRVYTRNAIIGKCRRMGIPLNYKPEESLVTPKTKKFVWSDHAIKMMQDLAEQGFSAAIIAEQMSEHYKIHISRNQVIGKAYRVGGSLRAVVAKPVYRRNGTRMQIYVEAPEAPMSKRQWGRNVFPNPQAVGVKFLDLEFKHCRYPVGEIRDQTLMFCGAPRMDVSIPYCEVCHKIVYVPTSLKKGGPRQHREARNVRAN